MPLRILHNFIHGCLLLLFSFFLIIHLTSTGLYNYANQGKMLYQNANSNYLMTNSGSMEMSLDEIYHSSGERYRRKRSRSMEMDENENDDEFEDQMDTDNNLEEMERIRKKRRSGQKPIFRVPVDLWEEGAEAEFD